jgi:hypothetical protein
MAVWIKTAWVATVLIVPGGFLVFLAYIWARALVRAREKAQAVTTGGPVPLREVLAEVRFRDLVREARAAL